MSNSLSAATRGQGLVDQRANRGCLLLPVGVRTGWLHRSGQEARGCSQRSLALLIFVFLKEEIKGQALWLQNGQLGW